MVCVRICWQFTHTWTLFLLSLAAKSLFSSPFFTVAKCPPTFWQCRSASDHFNLSLYTWYLSTASAWNDNSTTNHNFTVRLIDFFVFFKLCCKKILKYGDIKWSTSLKAWSFPILRDRASFSWGPGRVYRQGGRHFFWDKKRGARTFFQKKIGGQVVFSSWKKGGT